MSLYGIAGVELRTDHETPSGVADVAVFVKYKGQWLEVRRTPLVDGGVIAHTVTDLGLRELVKRAGLN